MLEMASARARPSRARLPSESGPTVGRRANKAGRDAIAAPCGAWSRRLAFHRASKWHIPKPAPANNPEWKGTTDLQQAQWITRSFLAISAIDIQRAYLYFFNDGDAPILHASSGITRHMEPKMSYWAMAHLSQSLGDYRLSKTIEKDPKGAYVFDALPITPGGGSLARRFWPMSFHRPLPKKTLASLI